jgi:predicted aspartyl protease
MKVTVPSLAFFFLVAVPAHAEDAACTLHREASLPLTTDDAGGVSVPMTIQGKTVHLLVDTGGVDSMLTVSTVDALQLPYGKLGGVYAEGYGGYRIEYFAEAHDVNLGGLAASKKQFLIMPDGGVGVGENGTLAPDILRAYDDDFDFANATLNLVSTEHCPGTVVYWTKGDHSVVDFNEDNSGHVDVIVQMDGAKFRVHLDTGFSRSVMNLEEARNLFHFDMESPDLKEVKEPGFEHAYRLPFKSLTFGGVTINNPDIILVPENESHAEGAILGIQVLRQLHLYIARREGKLYITPATAH